jgi:hypothetical protein
MGQSVVPDSMGGAPLLVAAGPSSESFLARPASPFELAARGPAGLGPRPADPGASGRVHSPVPVYLMALVLVLVLVLAGAGAGAGVLVVLVLVRRVVMNVFFARSLVQLPRTPPAPLHAPCGALRAAPANGGSYWLLATGYWPCVWGAPFGVLAGPG